MTFLFFENVSWVLPVSAWIIFVAYLAAISPVLSVEPSFTITISFLSSGYVVFRNICIVRSMTFSSL